MKIMVVPGLVDLQVNGYRGVDFFSPALTEDSFAGACRQMLKEGASAFLPTIITSGGDVYEHNLPIMAKVIHSDEFRGRVLGIHLEGPFISSAEGARGAHNAQWVRKPDLAYLKHLLDLAGHRVKLITIAAEPDGADELTQFAAENGIAVSLGHQTAGVEDLQRLAKAGARALTHLGNGVPLTVPRHDNPIFAGLAVDELSAMIITDGHHLPAGLIKTIVRTKGADKCIVTSDATTLSRMGPGEYDSAGNKVVLDESGRIYNPETGYLVGSSATMLDCMNYLASLDLLSVEGLVQAGFYNPLALIGLSEDNLAEVGVLEYDEQRGLFYLR